MWARALSALPLFLAATGLFLAALDAYAVVTLLPQMLADVELSINDIQTVTPIVSGFLGGYVIAIPTPAAGFPRTRPRWPSSASAPR